jgi:hypothetical protein
LWRPHAFNSASQVFADAFVAAIARLEKGYVQGVCTYIAIKVGERFEIIQGRVFLNTAATDISPLNFQSPNVRAGRFAMTSTDTRPFIEALLTGSLTTPNDTVHFSPQSGGQHGASFVPFHPDGLRTQVRYNVLSLNAGPVELSHQPDIDWEVKAAAHPYDGIQELANKLGLARTVGPTATVEIVAFNVGAMDGNASSVSETHADPRILIAKGLDKERASLGGSEKECHDRRHN